MQSSMKNKTVMAVGAALALGLSLGGAPGAQAAYPAPLAKSIKEGQRLFSHETFGGNGNTCQSCHLGGGKGPGAMPNGKKIPSLETAAAIFPRYNPRAGKVVTLEDQVRSCVAGALQGKPPAYGSEQLTALVSYLTSLGQGKPIDMGGRP